MKKCYRCKQLQALSSFSKDRTHKDGFSRSCKNCSSNAAKAYYLKHKIRLGLKNTQSKIVKRAWLDSVKLGKGCKNCGFNSHPAALDFHHIDPKSKDSEVSNLFRKGQISKAKLEIEKCIILCSNCHRIHHAKESAGKSSLKRLAPSAGFEPAFSAPLQIKD